jgi:predicted nucleic acid-binding protein
VQEEKIIFRHVIRIALLEKEQLLTADRRQLSLVDCSSFETMRRLGIKKVFSFDEHFREQDFEVIP